MSADWPVWLLLRVAGLATCISVAIGLSLVFLQAGRELPGALGVLPMRFKAILSAPVFFYCLGVRAGFWPFAQGLLIAVATLSTLPVFASRAGAALSAADPGFARAARSMGASDWLIFSRVQLPMALRPVLVSALDAFLAISIELAFAWWFTVRIVP